MFKTERSTDKPKGKIKINVRVLEECITGSHEFSAVRTCAYKKTAVMCL